MATRTETPDLSLDEESVKALRKVKDDNCYARIGQTLRQERDRQKLRLREITELTGITSSNLQLLEAGELQDSQVPAIVKGYIKCYARALEIPLHDLLQTYQQALDSEKQHPEQETEKTGVAALLASLPTVPVSIVAGVLLILVIFLVLPAQSNVLDDQQQNLAQDAGSLRADTLDILPARESWVEITDSLGNILKAGYIQPGAPLQAVGSPPFQVLLKEGAIRVNYLSETVHLTAKSGDNSATFGD